LQTRVGLALGGLLLGLSVVLALVLSHAAKRQVLELSASNLENLGQQLARELSTGMDNFLREVIAQTLRGRLRSAQASNDSMRAALDEFQDTYPWFSYVAIVDATTATVLAAGRGVFEGGSARGRPVFEQGLKAPFLGDVHDAARLAELLPKPADGEALRFLDVSAPVRDASGRVFRVLAAHVAWEWTKDLRQRIFDPLQAQRGVEAFLVDTSGKVVLGDAARMPTGTDLAAVVGPLAGAHATRVTWDDGHDYLTFVAATAPSGRFAGFGWKVVARQPFDAALAPAQTLRNAFLAGALALGLGAIPLAWMVAGRLVRPVRQLAEAASAMGGVGAPAPPMPTDGRLGEVSAVQHAIVRLQDSARRQAQATAAAQRQFAVLAESLPQGVWLTNAHGVLEYVNQPWIRQHQADRALAVEVLEALIIPEDRLSFEQAWRSSLATGEDLRLRCRLHVSDTSPPRWFDIEASAVKDDGGQLLHWVGTLHECATW
jgi:PAS domain-containing protein